MLFFPWLAVPTASDMSGWITVKGAKEITGKLGYHPLSSTSGITGSRVYLYGTISYTCACAHSHVRFTSVQ